jgi:hypothetical protein
MVGQLALCASLSAGWKQHPIAAFVVDMMGLLFGLAVQVWKFAVAWGLTTWLVW